MDQKLFFDHREKVTSTSSKITKYKCNSKLQNQNFHGSKELYSLFTILYVTLTFSRQSILDQSPISTTPENVRKLKTTENHWFCDVFRGDRNGTLGCNRFRKFCYFSEDRSYVFGSLFTNKTLPPKTKKRLFVDVLHNNCSEKIDKILSKNEGRSYLNE